ncbi:conserved protein of unknown function [Tepidanaerobacter acetatoxydans Re1]|uniref:DUF2922 domain-containing protein n=1 Tax=Tepidanaerobacter acetatoxydans (strain DSM 21804 / JCM 16047 / Re1) TaxID=1209989 RepID=F4LXB4_TEPAE|nr:DUF2922 domain-containing protein [Tepidanaerobacter acetatoxydans]AEE91913.1 hypothetical protein TepRe1_1782 [Tepidanaerobacter acetatoxydans Re1]CDI40854.1 conserved protein of unknown function [Tepidanaerobacter acetatoxydans Re1]
MDTNLELVFRNRAGKNARISLQDPKDDLTADEVQALMDNIVTKNVFETTGGDLIEAVEARLIQKEVVQLIG